MVMTGGSPFASAFGVDNTQNPLGAISSQMAMQGVLVPQQVLDPETQATSTFLQATTGCVIPKLSNYVGKHVAQFPQLQQCVPLITRAAEFYGQRDFPRAFSQAYQVYRMIAILRTRQPSLPDPAA